MNRTLLFALFVLFLSPKLQAQNAVDHWETGVYFDNIWKYFVGASEPDALWRELSYNDTNWPSGQGGVGFGDGDDNTTIPASRSVYIRTYFTVTDTSKIEAAMLSIDYDDGFIAFLNDVEIARSNLGAMIGDHPPYIQFANGQHEAQMYQGGNPESYFINRVAIHSALLPGNNVLALQVHNATQNSPDLSSNTWLHFGMGDTNTQFGPNPNWFQIPFFDSNLPIVVINTNGAAIVDDPRITANLGIISKGPGLRNTLNDPFNDYDGNVAIEIRGSTSQQYPKKSYGFETQDSLGNNNNVSLLGMPKENDWILYAPYPDKTMIRNVLTYDLFGRMGHWSPRTRYCELVINSEYRGVYVLLERIKRDGDRLDLDPLSPTSTSGDSLSGGYVIKIDKTTGTGGNNWTSPFSNDVFFQFHDPEETELNISQQNYIENFVTDFETALNGPNYTDPVLGYRKYIDVNSFMDFLLMQELGRTVDGYRSSSFMHKNKDSRGGKLQAGPMWDFNLSYGNANYCDAFRTNGWQYEFNQICNNYSPEVPFWWSRFLTDTRFRSELACRWQDLRTSYLHTDSLHAFIDSVALHLNESQTRNFNRWPILGVYVNWNDFVGQTYQEEIDYLKTWIGSRLTWMDQNLPVLPTECLIMGAEQITITEINYHSDSLNEAGDWFEIHNLGVNDMDLTEWVFKDENPSNLFYFSPGTILKANEYLVVCSDTALFRSVHDTVQNFVGPFNFSLGNGKDMIRLYDAGFNPVLAFGYNDRAPWPLEPDGDGPTLEVLDPLGDLGDGNNWFAGCPLGSPGQAFFPCPVAVEEATENAAGILNHGFEVFPNPFGEEAVLRLEDGLLENGGVLTLEMYDMTGRLVRDFGEISAKETALSRMGLGDGVYLLELKLERRMIGVRRVVLW